MEPVKAIIVDDERLARVNLRRLLEPFPEIEVAGEAGTCEEAFKQINYSNPQLIFLDIQLIGETGFDLLELLDHPVKVIFVTAFDEYAIRAFEVNAIDYLLKPVNPDRLKDAVRRVINPDNQPGDDKRCYQYTDSIYVRLNNFASRFIKISSITNIEPVGNYSRLFTADGKHFLVLKTLKRWQDELPPGNFARIHRSTIVNLEHIDRIERKSDSTYTAYLKNLTRTFDISRRYARKIKSRN